MNWKDLSLFRGLSSVEKETILASPGWLVRSYDPGVSIHDSGLPMDSLIILTSGKVEGDITTEAGRRLNLTRRDAPALIGPAMVFGDGKSLLRVRAVERTELMKLSRIHLRALFMDYPLLLDNFLRICSNRFHYLSSRLELLSFHSIRKKVAHYVLEKYEKEGSPFVRRRTITSLAEFMGVERPSLSSVFHGMKREGLFRDEGKKIFVDNPKKLQEELERD